MLRIFEKYIKKNKNGSVLTFVVLMTLMLSIVGASLLGLGINARMDAVRDSDQMSARAAADSGVAQAVHQMNNKIESEVVWDGSDIPSVEDIYLPNCNANYDFLITGDPSTGYKVESVGRSGSQEKTIVADLELKGLYEYAIFANSDIEVKMGTTVDGFNYDADDPQLQIGTNSIDEDAIGLKSFVTVEGDVVIGPDGDPDIVVDNKLDATVNGDFINLPQTWDLPMMTVPEPLASMSSSGTIVGGEVITTSGKYDYLHMMGTNSKVTIDGDVMLYIVDYVAVGNNCTIEIVDLATNPDASLTLFVGGTYQQKSDSHIINHTQDPKRLTIIGLEGCTSISFLGESTFYGTIYAPNSHLYMHNSVEIFGSVIVDRFEQHVAADFHYDASLQEVSINDIGVQFIVDRWQE
jgi:hypothetical protein